MATDIKEIIQNLLEFYQFDHQSSITVGAGGGQMIEYGRTAKNVFAIDHDQEALEKLKANLINTGLTQKFQLIHSDFFLTHLKGDVVMFEFCLHEMPDPAAALRHAETMAPNILITDHLPGSEWAYIVDEREKVIQSWAALELFAIKKLQKFDTFQFFRDYDELYQKVKVQGENSIQRINCFKDKTHFTIPMSYGFCLI
ncbi:methyltransferase domain-containing protein [candidate division KSB1 bacterium]|nr:methyltransferase domain-containing protein [candidate division KSB1 bacterium]